MKKCKQLLITITVTLLFVSLSLPSAYAAGWPPAKPRLISIATFDIGASTYADTAAVGNGINKKFDVKVRNVPLGTSVARALATKTGATDFWATASAYYACAEGIFDFATIEWGPQPLTAVYIANRTACYSPATSKKSGIKKLADVKGKRVAWILGNPTINMQTEGYLAFAGLTMADVELVKFPGYPASLKGIIGGQVDFVLAGNESPGTYEIDASPEGLFWIPIPHNDVKGWERIRAKAPFVVQGIINKGAGGSPKNPVQGGTYSTPWILAWKQQDEGLAYWLTKMVAESWELYKDSAPTGQEFNIKECLVAGASRSVPFHTGSIKYFKEKNLWTDEQEKRQQYLLNRQEVLGEAFKAVKNEFTEKGLKTKEFPDFWQKKRLEALEAAGLPAF